ncbi:MAG: hypothetical protein ACYDCO_26675 [Armatimonadota bacterium]
MKYVIGILVILLVAIGAWYYFAYDPYVGRWELSSSTGERPLIDPVLTITREQRHKYTVQVGDSLAFPAVSEQGKLKVTATILGMEVTGKMWLEKRELVLETRPFTARFTRKKQAD